MKTKTSELNNNAVGFIIFGLLALLLFRNFFVIPVMNSFIFLDKLFSFGEDNPPYAGWAIFGLLTGTIYGIWVAQRKYKLHGRLILMPISAVILFVTILFLINKPLKAATLILPETSQKQDAFSYINVSSSGYLSGNTKLNYSHNNLIDEDMRTAWIEGFKQSGINEWIQFEFNSVQKDISRLKNFSCIGFRIRNGYQKTNKTWQDHNRVESFTLYHNNNFVRELRLANNDQQQFISISPVLIKNGDRLKLYINSVYPGKKIADQTAVTSLIPVVEYLVK